MNEHIKRVSERIRMIRVKRVKRVKRVFFSNPFITLITLIIYPVIL